MHTALVAVVKPEKDAHARLSKRRKDWLAVNNSGVVMSELWKVGISPAGEEMARLAKGLKVKVNGDDEEADREKILEELVWMVK